MLVSSFHPGSAASSLGAGSFLPGIVFGEKPENDGDEHHGLDWGCRNPGLLGRTTAMFSVQPGVKKTTFLSQKKKFSTWLDRNPGWIPALEPQVPRSPVLDHFGDIYW